MFGGGMGEMIRRFDRNGNNLIEPEEVQGPAGFFLQRMAQNNSKIDLSKPIPIDMIVSEIERMRGGSSYVESSSSSSSYSSSGKKEPELLVPDFRIETVPAAVPGFGKGSESAQPIVKVQDRDRQEAVERIRRYDRNGDSVLDAEEISRGRWSGDEVMSYDRNRDGKLSIEELAVRYASRREAEQNQDSSGSSSGGNFGYSSGWGSGSSGGWSRGDSRDSRGGTYGGRGEDKSKKSEENSRFGDSKSYKTTGGTTDISGLPSFFGSSDADGDQQVTLSEFAGSLTAKALEEFQLWDLNADGIITARECQAAVKAGVKVGGGTPSPSASGSSSSSTVTASKGGASAADIEKAKSVLGKYDKNGDGSLSKDEVEKMVIKPKGADLNNDGKISLEEYAAHRSK